MLPSNPRVLMVRPGPHFSVADVHRGWLRAFTTLGCQVVDLNLDDRLAFYEGAYVKKGRRYVKAVPSGHAIGLAAKGIEVACYEWWPHIVVITSGFFVPPDTLEVVRARGHRTVMLATESPYQDDQQAQQAGLVDVMLLNDPTNLERFRQINPATFYQPHGYDPQVHHPGPAEPGLEADFTFVGTGYPSRIAFFEQVDWSGLDVRLAGNWQAVGDGSPLLPLLMHDRGECVDNDDTVRLYRSAQASANLYRKEANPGGSADGWAMGPREVELAACGTFFLREPRGESDEVLPMLPSFEGPDDFEATLRWWLAHEDVRHKAAEDARAAVADRTFENHARRLLQLLDDKER